MYDSVALKYFHLRRSLLLWLFVCSKDIVKKRINERNGIECMSWWDCDWHWGPDWDPNWETLLWWDEMMMIASFSFINREWIESFTLSWNSINYSGDLYTTPYIYKLYLNHFSAGIYYTHTRYDRSCCEYTV